MRGGWEYSTAIAANRAMLALPARLAGGASHPTTVPINAHCAQRAQLRIHPRLAAIHAAP